MAAKPAHTDVTQTGEPRFTLLGVGAMNSPRYAPAGLLVECGGSRVMIDGGPGAEPKGKLNAWLVTDDRGELIRKLRQLARPRGLEPHVGSYLSNDVSIKPYRVVHTSHDTYGYVIRCLGKKIVWAPEFFVFPHWASNADIMFAEAAGWNRPIFFRGKVGGHAPVEHVARDALKYKIRRLVFAHIGRPTIKALDAGKRAKFGEFGRDRRVFKISTTAE